jgi:membrane protease YdiL (CAAX protease family)
MADELQIPGNRCDYCGQTLDARVYFCPGCAKPHRPVEMLLTPSAPRFENLETRLRTKAPEVWTIFFVFLTAMVISAMLGLAIWGTDHREPVMLLVSFVLLAVTAACTVRYWLEVKPLLKAPGMFTPAAWLGLAALVPMLALNYGYHTMLTSLLGLEAEDYNGIFTSSYGPVLFICIMPAVVEELAYRGIIQHRLESVLPPWIAMAAASVLFSAAHFSVLSAPYLALLGFLFGWMKWKTGSLYPPMIAHFLHNYIVIRFFET